MTDGAITTSPFKFDGAHISGEYLACSKRLLRDLKGVFANEKAYQAMNPDTEVYHVSSVLPETDGTEGGLYMGITYLQSGKVGNEYFMTKGHFHKNKKSTEYYWGVKGTGMLILMDRDGKVWAEKMTPGSLHYIKADVAHRVANIGDTELVFSACWPSDAGHDYETIAQNGFAKRLVEIDGKPQLV